VSLYTSVLVVHVLVAVLGLGSIASVDGDLAIRRVARHAYGMCALIAIIAVLMEVKPF
jgi:hypothetical protein